jgi:predicted TIM-barrel fold metal-dependent hydrolase
LVIVCGYIGYPWTTQMIAVADKHPNVYIDTSAYAAHRYPAEFVEHLQGRGKTKALFATNYPMLTAGQALARLDHLGLDDETRSLFLAGNARRVFRL